MTLTSSTFSRDGNHIPITNLGLIATKTITYSTLTTGAVGTTTLFTVTGQVAVTVFGLCTTDLTGAGTIEIGTATSTACLCAQQNATAIDNHEVWYKAVLAIGGVVAPFVPVNENIIQTIATDTVDSGVISFYCCWNPLSSDGNVVAA